MKEKYLGVLAIQFFFTFYSLHMCLTIDWKSPFSNLGKTVIMLSCILEIESDYGNGKCSYISNTKLSCLPKRPRQTVQSQIRLGLPCLLFSDMHYVR